MDVIDLRAPEHKDKPISSFELGTIVTGVNGTDTKWRVSGGKMGGRRSLVKVKE